MLTSEQIDEEISELADSTGLDEATVTAVFFVTAIVRGEFDGAWSRVDDDARVNAAHVYLERSFPDRAGEAGALVRLGAEHALWDVFARSALASWQLALSEVDLERSTFFASPSVIAPDVVAVFVIDVGCPMAEWLAPDTAAPDEEAFRRAHPVMLRYTPNGYRVWHLGAHPWLA